MGVDAKTVLQDHLGDNLNDLEDILDYLVSIVEESSVDVTESIETLASMIEGAVQEDTAEETSKKIIDQYNKMNGISTEKETKSQTQLLDAPIKVGLGNTNTTYEYIKQADQVSLIENL